MHTIHTPGRAGVLDKRKSTKPHSQELSVTPVEGGQSGGRSAAKNRVKARIYASGLNRQRTVMAQQG